jgi:exosome complex component RRP41
VLSASLGVLSHTDGSAIFELGNTKVLATVHGPREARGQRVHDHAVITVNFHAATFSSVSGERRRQMRLDRKQAEWCTFIRETLESVILTSSFPRSQIDVFIEVLNADGGTAPRWLRCMTSRVLGVLAASHIQGQPLLDLNRIEEASNNPSMTIALLPRSGQVAFMALEPRLEADRLEALMDLAKSGTRKLWEILDGQIVRPHVASLYKGLHPRQHERGLVE